MWRRKVCVRADGGEQVGEGPGRMQPRGQLGARLRVWLSPRCSLKVVSYSPCLWAPELSRGPGTWKAQETLAELNQ